MAKLDVMPQKDVIDAFRGKVDFYRWCDLVIARSWPRGDYRFRSEAVKASQVPFSYIATAFAALPGAVRELYDPLASHGGLTAKDWATRLYINGYKNVREHPQPVPDQGLGEDPTMLHFLDPWITVYSHPNLAAPIAWTDVDLSAHLPLDVQAVYCRGYFRKSNAACNANWYTAWVRGKTLTPSWPLYSRHLAAQCRFYYNPYLLVPITSDRTLQYKMDHPAAIVIESNLLQLVAYLA